ncbi:MAG: hypothetical protein A3G70_04925 [Planctomycetes bacterium RIFCSPLOWO2_12_FULL_39_13]|nr:MAG: hypothetical protein A3G70_04925 [Planctomycetes bacterium RIFCSPLOWO2_12_FULL_39_13]
MPVPKILAHIMSLARPSNRLKKVQTLIILTERNKSCDSDINNFDDVYSIGFPKCCTSLLNVRFEFSDFGKKILNHGLRNSI